MVQATKPSNFGDATTLGTTYLKLYCCYQAKEDLCADRVILTWLIFFSHNNT